MKIYLSHSSSFDYEEELYKPIKVHFATDHDIFLPHDRQNVDIKSKDIIEKTDILIAEVSFPSTGQGIELGWANANNILIVCFYGKDATPSRSLRFVCQNFIQYEDKDELIARLRAFIDSR